MPNLACLHSSLYPYVCKYGKFVLGHPTIITENFQDIIQHPYEGVVKATVLLPRRLFHPVLPARINDKLVFTLCNTCAINSVEAECQHSEEDRQITGTWITEELYTAIGKGYKILKIHEVWHYERVSQYNPITKSGGLFTEYIDKFLKLKQESDGFPASIVTDIEKDNYIDQYYQHEGIKLDKNKIQKNSGFRSLAKLMLNCKHYFYVLFC